MTAQARRSLWRNGSWLITHGFKRLRLWFYDLAQADWEVEQEEVQRTRERLARTIQP